MKLNLNYQIADEKLNPISLFDTPEKLTLIIKKNKFIKNKFIPNIATTNDSEIRNELIQV